MTKSSIAQLQEAPRWLLWSWGVRDGKQTKIPRQPNGQPARSNDPSTWVDYSEARMALHTRPDVFAGVGIVLGDGLAGIDIDWKNYDGDGIPTAAQTIIDRFATYAELSPSGKGAHILLLGRLPTGARNRAQLAPGVDIEVYDHNRYFTFTGRSLGGCPDITDQQEQLEALLSELGMLPSAPERAPSQAAQGIAQPVTLSDAELLDRMLASKSGPEIRQLWGGDWRGAGYPSQSEADLALVSHLLWWTNGDVARADRLFRQSGLYRPKWDERHRSDGRTYGQATLERALAGLDGGYSPNNYAVGRLSASESQGNPLEGLSGGGEVSAGYPRYVVRAGMIQAARVEGRGEGQTVRYYPLANFAAIVRRSVIATDGVVDENFFEIDGYLHNGEELPRIRVRAADFVAMNWPVTRWGPEVIVSPGQGARDTLRAAIQHLSQNQVERATIYKHLGWAKLNGHWHYLHAGGAIAAIESAQVEMDVGRILDGFVLPEPPTGEAEGERITQLLELLYLAPHRVTVPLLLYALGAPLGHTPFSLYLAGPTGVRKTSLALVYQSMFGYSAPTPPIGWEATANALEGAAFAAKDSLLLIDDYAPTGNERAQKELQAKAARLLRSQGNAVGRLRMRADGSLAGDRPPRGALLITGEDLPPGHSVRARTLFIELNQGDVDLHALADAQALAREGVWAEAMAGWIRYLAGDPEAYMERLRARMEELRPSWEGGHGRTMDALARLQAVWELYRDYASSVGVDLSRIDPIVQDALGSIRDAQRDYHRDVDPAMRFMRLLYTALRMGRGYMAPLEMQANEDVSNYIPAPSLWGWQYKQVAGVWEPQGPRIGWLPQDWEGRGIYLDPPAAWAIVNRLAVEQGEPLPTERVLWRRLAELGVIRSETDGGAIRYAVRIRLGGQLARAVHVLSSHVPKEQSTT